MPFGFQIAPDTLPSGTRATGSRSALAVSGFRLRARLGFSIPPCFPGQRGITPAFGYDAPHPSAEGTSTPLIHALPSTHYASIRHPASPLMAPVIPRHKRPPATTWRQKQGFLGSNAILACVMWPSTPAEWRSLAIAAPRIWPSTAVTVSASAISRITWLIPTPHRLTVYASAAPLPDAPATLVIGRLARPYPSGTFPRRIALTSPSARRLRRNPQAIGRSQPNGAKRIAPPLLKAGL